MTPRLNLMAAGAALLLLGGLAGIGLARMFDGHGRPPAGTSSGSEEHADAARGEPVFVALKPADAAEAGVQLAIVERGGGVDLLLPGRVDMVANAQAQIGSPLDGVLLTLHVAPGSSVRKGSPLASIRSEDGAAARARQDAALAALDLANAMDARDRKLFDEGAISRQQWETTHAATLKAEADLRSARAAVVAVGTPDEAGIVIVRSPITGTVTRVSTAPGAFLDEGGAIAAVVDSSKAELVFDAPPASIAGIVIGAEIEARTAAGGIVRGKITGIGPGAAGGVATVRAQALGPTPPPGTVISGRLSGGGDALTVPSEAVQTIGGAPSVFVVDGEGFRAKRVVTGRVSAGRTEIVRGLEGSEQIAGIGAFLLKAELGKGEAGEE
jgi:cobalt-zinc-cadmium efflux system membrane fusion protein